jgi:pyridoxine kinase
VSRVLVMSSWTSAGHVGLSAAAPALQLLGHAVTQLPTVVLSNHPGWPTSAGFPVPPQQLAGIVDAIDANGWVDGHDAFLTGYLPSAAHVAVACDVADRLRRLPSPPRVLVDPVLGDEPKGLYVSCEAATAVRDALVPRADVLTPNLFELGWLTGRSVATLADVRAAALALAKGAREVLVTSAPVSGTDTGVLAVAAGGAALFRNRRIEDVPHGAGDVFSALIAAGLSAGAALGHLRCLVEASQGAPHLHIVGSAERWTRAGPVSGEPLS